MRFGALLLTRSTEESRLCCLPDVIHACCNLLFLPCALQGEEYSDTLKKELVTTVSMITMAAPALGNWLLCCGQRRWGAWAACRALPAWPHDAAAITVMYRSRP